MNRVKEFRLKKGLTQHQLGIAIGKYQSWIYQLERGYREADEIQKEKLSEVLEVAAEELFPAEGPVAAQPKQEVEMAWFESPT